jgi:D-3-phosphoglycerate dehydrogenase
LKALIVDRIHPDGVGILQRHAQVDTILEITPEHLQKIVADYDLLIGRSTPTTPRIEAPLLDNAGRLKVIGIASVGLDQVDQPYVKNKGIQLINLPGVNALSVAEHAFALILSGLRRVPQAYEQMKLGNWNKHGYTSVREISERTLGVIGLGSIGSETARIAQNGFRMRVLAYDPYLSSETCRDRGAEKRELVDLLAESDVVVIHAPLTEETYHLIGKAEIERMKQGSMLFNLGRGGIVDEEALYAALASGHLDYAGLDVQEQEPMTSSPLLSLENFVATPHIAGLTRDALRRAGIRVVTECLRAVGINP